MIPDHWGFKNYTRPPGMHPKYHTTRPKKRIRPPGLQQGLQTTWSMSKIPATRTPAHQSCDKDTILLSLWQVHQAYDKNIRPPGLQQGCHTTGLEIVILAHRPATRIPGHQANDKDTRQPGKLQGHQTTSPATRTPDHWGFDRDTWPLGLWQGHQITRLMTRTVS